MSVVEGEAGIQRLLADPDLKTITFNLDNGGKVIFPHGAITNAVVVVEEDPEEGELTP
jgi:hypothetical protein